MWRAWVTAVRQRRAIWVQEVQPGLVAGDPWVALIRVSMTVLSVAVVDWSYMREISKVLTVSAHLGTLFVLSIIRFYYSRYHPVQYGRWRWLLILVLNCMAVSYQSYVTHLFALPSHTLGGYLKNLLLYSGLVLSMQSPLLHLEMFYFICPFLGLVVGVLCYNAEKVCHQALLATDYGIKATRIAFHHVGGVINVIATVARPFEADPLVAVPGPPDPTKDLPSCICLVRTLLVSFSFLLPSVLLFMHEDQAIRRGMRLRGQQQPPGHHRQLDPEGVQGGLFNAAVVVITVVLLGGTWTWAAQRWYLEV